MLLIDLDPGIRSSGFAGEIDLPAFVVSCGILRWHVQSYGSLLSLYMYEGLALDVVYAKSSIIQSRPTKILLHVHWSLLPVVTINVPPRTNQDQPKYVSSQKPIERNKSSSSCFIDTWARPRLRSSGQWDSIAWHEHDILTSSNHPSSNQISSIKNHSNKKPKTQRKEEKAPPKRSQGKRKKISKTAKGVKKKKEKKSLGKGIWFES